MRVWRRSVEVKGMGRGSIDGGQPSDVMEIILTGPTHWDLGG